jgi:hypothetical protein
MHRPEECDNTGVAYHVVSGISGVNALLLGFSYV